MKAALYDDDGVAVDVYDLPEHEYYELRSPDGALICELKEGHDAGGAFAPSEDPGRVMSLEPGNRVVAEVPSGTTTLIVGGTDDDPEPRDTLDVEWRADVETAGGSGAELEVMSTGRVRLVRDGGLTQNVTSMRVERGLADE